MARTLLLSVWVSFKQPKGFAMRRSTIIAIIIVIVVILAIVIPPLMTRYYTFSGHKVMFLKL